MGIIMAFLGKFKKTIIQIVVMLVTVTIITLMYKRIRTLKADNQRMKSNIEYINQQVETYKSKSGKTVSTVNSLTIKAKELQYLNSKLEDQLKDMRLKVKNLQSAASVNSDYNVEVDTIYTTVYQHDTSLRNIDWNDSFASIKAVYNVPKQYLYNVQLNIRDTLVIANEIKYKRFWIFWKRPVGMKIHIKSENPYNHIDEIKSYQFFKK